MVEKDLVLCSTELNPLGKLFVQLFGVSTYYAFYNGKIFNFIFKLSFCPASYGSILRLSYVYPPASLLLSVYFSN